MNLKDNIFEEIIAPITAFLDESEKLTWQKWRDIQDTLLKLIDDGHTHELHEAMNNLYNRYLYADEALYNYRKKDVLDLVRDVIKKDEEFAEFAASLDMVELTEFWVNKGSTYNYMNLLNDLLTINIKSDWKSQIEAMNQKLLELEVHGDNVNAEFCCILHGFLMIMIGSNNHKDRQTRFEMFKNNWLFLRHLYSIMVRRIVGMGFSNFASVANNAKASPYCIPYLKLLYAPLIERHDELCQLGTKAQNLDKAIVKISEVMSHNEQSDELDELCEVLFPEEIREMLNKHRLPTYKQLKVENLQLREQQQELRKQIQDQLQQTNAEIAKLTDAMKAGMEAAIPVEQIEQELMKLPAGMAWGMFEELYKLLGANEIWRQYDINIRQKLLDRLNAESSSKVTFEGDYVVNKHVANEVGHVESGATGISTRNK